MGPSFCNKSLPFDYEKIKWLENDLNAYWPNLYANTAHESFWQHEWEKHGTCAISLPQITSESGYFNVSLELRKKFDFGRMLNDSSIVADDAKDYDLSAIKAAIRQVTGVEPLVECYRSGDVQYIVEMQICLSKTFAPIECGSSKAGLRKKRNTHTQSESPCVNGLPVRYPTIKNN